MDRAVEPQNIADLIESLRRLCLTFHIDLLRYRHERDLDIGPGPFDLETRQYGIIRSK